MEREGFVASECDGEGFMTNIDEKIFETMAAVFSVPRSKLNEGTSVDTLTAWDSLKHMNLVLALESAFGVHFDDSELVDLVSFKLIKNIVESKMK